MRRGLACCLMIAACLALAPAGARAENRALLVGIGQYRIAEANLPGIDHDLNMMAEVAELLGFERSQIKTVKDSQATLAGLRGAIEDWLIKGVGERDRVLFYYSGHGSQIPDRTGSQEDGKSEVLLCHDVEVRDKQLTNIFEDHEFARMLARIPSKQTLVFIDSCNSGHVTKGFMATKGVSLLQDEVAKFFQYPGLPLNNPALTKGRVEGTFLNRPASAKGGAYLLSSEFNYLALMACRHDQVAVASNRGSVFTRAVWSEVKKASQEGRSLSVADLKGRSIDFIQRNITDPAKRQDPQVFGNRDLLNQSLSIKSASAGQPAPAAQAGDLWTKLEQLADKADYKVNLQSNQSSYKIGDTLVINCQVQQEGYINVLNVGPGEEKATVLFPNQYHKDNLVKAGTTVTIPGPGDNFVLRAREPKGKNLVVVLLTQKPINAYLDGQKKSMNDLFAVLSAKDYRSFAVEEGKPGPSAQSQGGGVGAGKIITNIE